ncbi:hypothetical protein [Pseudomonas frederiksbergensis]|uniref:Uncharacterized protein n=1 Tax=Pseudomonas frederiksbergensis TaxID=104087 RepID=A0A423K7T1_9PSED|nr:hypothetical protein [Pseudomonas frederiksbergensis]RON47811.1 hypothetical protein BK665_26035 [Pseudomonas frederiksbergensis]
MEEQVVGYSLPELKSVFAEPLSPLIRAMADYPQVVSLEGIGVSAYYSAFLATDDDAVEFEALVESNFRFVAEKPFNGLPVKLYSDTRKNEHLIYFKSDAEFNATTIRMVTNSVDFLSVIQNVKLAVPPPWIAFAGYKPSWWGGAMEGAQGYYNDNYFLPFFTRLSSSERQQYYAKFHASDEWIKSLELMYDGE